MNDDEKNQISLWISLHKSKILISEMTDILQKMELLHSERLDLNVCVECFQPWPCRTLETITYGDQP